VTDYVSIPNPTKKGKKWDYRVGKNMQNRLPKDIVKTLRDNALKYTKRGKK
jgi:hypothetical protein